MIPIENLYERLLHAFRDAAVKNKLLDEPVPIRCKPLSAAEAIGRPNDQDYPILKGKEAIVEAAFRGSRGQAFTEVYGNSDRTLRDFLAAPPESPRKRAEFIAALNAVYRHLGLVDHTVHCRNEEPVECGRELAGRISPGMQVLLAGCQPRMLQALAAQNPVRCVDLDPENIGTVKFGVTVEGPEKTEEAIEWSHVILATGSTIVNGTLPVFLRRGKPVVFFGVTISAAASILGLDAFCPCGA